VTVSVQRKREREIERERERERERREREARERQQVKNVSTFYTKSFSSKVNQHHTRPDTRPGKVATARRCRAKRAQLETFKDSEKWVKPRFPLKNGSSQGENLAWTVLYLPSSLDKPRVALRGGIPWSFLGPLGRSWSHYVGIYRQKLTRSLKN